MTEKMQARRVQNPKNGLCAVLPLISEITIAHELSPLGTDAANPQIAWKFTTDEQNFIQRTARITVGTKHNSADMWDSGELLTDRSIGIEYGGKPLQPCTRYYVSVASTSESGTVCSGNTEFETGFLNGGIEPWEGAEWIGAPEYYVCGEVMGVFAIECALTIFEGGCAGIVFGADDPRLMNAELNEKRLCGENYIQYSVSLKENALKIFRVGYDSGDSACEPFAVIPVSGIEPQKPFTLRVEVTGNCASALINGMAVDERRQLNPLGDNDVPTYPRLCKIGYYAEKATAAHFGGISLSFLRKPASVFFTAEPNDLCADRVDIRRVFSPDCHSLPMLRRDFTAAKPISSARLYAAARGIYDCRINGQPISEQYFAPGASQFDKHLMYQTYDVTPIISEGENGICFTLASGWWSGSQTFTLLNYNYWGDKESVLAKLVLNYTDGSREVFVTNDSEWEYYGEGPYRFAGFFQGERFDGGRAWIYEQFSKPNFRIDGLKKPAVIKLVPIPEFDSLPGFFLPWGAVNYSQPKLLGGSPQVKAVECFAAAAVTSPCEGVYIFDMGQETAGVPFVKFHGKKGTKVRIRYGEMLYPEMYGELSGRLLQENLRDAMSTDIYTLGGSADGEVYSPKFTFHGYRYIEISGLSYQPELSDVRCVQLSSIKQITGSVTTDNELVNRFVKNVKYSQLSNFISIPTDCPQRNERMGWIGDAHVFAGTAAYQADVRGFFTRYLQMIRDVQLPDGNIPNIAPVGGGFGGITYAVGIHLIVREMYRHYGDVSVISENYEAMKRCVSYFEKLGMPGEVYVGPIDDWLAPSHTDSHLVWNAFYGRALRLMERFAGILGKGDDMRYYKSAADEAQNYWNAKFTDPQTAVTLNADGTPNDTQGGYSIGLGFELFAPKLREKAAANLARVSKSAGYTVTTGFFGTSPINPVLSEYGYSDDAFRMMTSTAYPSWLFPVTQGATTVWEHWDSYTAQRGFGEYNCMNSFNHYSFGAVVSWLYEYVLGIRMAEGFPAHKRFILKPELCGFNSAKGGIDTPHGRVEVAYRIIGGSVEYSCKIPPNTTAELFLPNIHKRLGSGSYTFGFTK